MNSEQWDNIQDLFHQCIERSLDEQKTFLENLEKENPQTAIEIKNS